MAKSEPGAGGHERGRANTPQGTASAREDGDAVSLNPEGPAVPLAGAPGLVARTPPPVARGRRDANGSICVYDGNPGISHSWNGAVSYFANQRNRSAFVSAPEKYAPAYGGYCAYAVANGYTAATDPEAWSVVDGRLLLNYSEGVKKR